MRALRVTTHSARKTRRTRVHAVFPSSPISTSPGMTTFLPRSGALTGYNGCPSRSPSRGNVGHVFELLILYFILQLLAVGNQCDVKPSRIQRYLGIRCALNTTSFRVPVGKLQKSTRLSVVKLAGRCSIDGAPVSFSADGGGSLTSDYPDTSIKNSCSRCSKC